MNEWEKEMVEGVLHPKPEFVPQPLVGFRHWRLHDEGKIGPSSYYYAGRRWNDDGIYNSSVPSLDAENAHKDMGVHAYYRFDQMQKFQQWCPTIMGAIVAWGWICEHVSGFRAQHAKLIAFAEIPLTSEILRSRFTQCAERYQVPVLADDELVMYAGWWGELRPDKRILKREE